MFQEIGKYNLRINFIPKTIEKDINFTIEQRERNDINPGLPLVVRNSVNFLVTHYTI